MLLAVVVCAALVALVHWRAHVNETRAEAAYPASGQFIDVDGTRVHAVVMGNGPDLVMIHGASGSLRDFTFEFAQRASQTHRVIVLDRPGLGRSDRPPGYGGMWNVAAESPTEQARILRAAALHLGADKPIVLGHSYGGAVALAWALDAPEETAALVLLAAASNPWPGNLGLLYNINSTRFGSAVVIPLITAFTPQRVVDGTVSSIFAPQKMPDGYLEHFGDRMTLRRKTMRANAQQVNGLRPHIIEMSKRYGSLNMPVEIVHGDADTIVPLQIHSLPLSQQIKGATLTVLEGIGHMPQHVAAPHVLDAIARATDRAGLR